MTISAQAVSYRVLFSDVEMMDEGGLEVFCKVCQCHLLYVSTPKELDIIFSIRI